jgi:hypothetical protein
LRQPNAIDFWRGFALITIFINHIPGNAFERFTYSRYSISDAAELFVFLAGWSLALATERRDAPDPPGRVLLRLASRTVQVYRAQLVIVLLALAMIAGAALLLENPLLLAWHNAEPFFTNPVEATVGLVLLTHQLGYFNILPLYVGLLVLAPVFILIARIRRWLALAASFGLYAACLAFELNLPSWPVEGHWFFNPLAWQFVLVLGFLSSLWARDSEAFRKGTRKLFPLGVLGVVAGLVVSVTHVRPDPFTVPEPRLFFLLDKSYVSPARLVDFIAVVLAFQRAYGPIANTVPWLVSPLCTLGRNSLAVFSIGSVAALGVQLIRAALPRSILLDFFTVLPGILLLWLTAWLVEWRSRSPKPSLQD